MNGFNPPVTPEKIVKEGWRFSIPIYQRLFVWESEQIDRLLEDLWNASNSRNHLPSPYYVGVVTTVEQDYGKEGRVFSVVDGQQRLTFLLLFFCECRVRGDGAGSANAFVFVNSSTDIRIRFIGRDNDEKDIQHYVRDELNDVKNWNFRQFHDRMEIFIKKHEDWETRKDDFINYVYENTSFLANELVGYSNADLNLYFEKMNSTGRQLSPLDQLKGLFATYASKWNDCFNFEKTGKENKSAREGNIGAGDDKSIRAQQDCQDEECDIDNIVNWRDKVSEEPSTIQQSTSFARLPMRSEVLALHALQLTLESKDDLKRKIMEKNKEWCSKSNDGSEDELMIDYSPRRLLDSFNKVFIAIGDNREEFAKAFMDSLQAYRDWIDDNIFYLRGEMETDGDEGIDSSGLKYAFRDVSSQQNQKMLQLQSMLCVSSGEDQEWIVDAYRRKCEKSDLFTNLKNHDANLHKLPQISELRYQCINRYWFWKLDYLLWEDYENYRQTGKSVFDWESLRLTSEESDAIHCYRFRQNRSIEHFHPQNGASVEWTSSADSNDFCPLHWYGNLCLISSSFNSQQSDDSVNTKCGRIDDQVQTNTLESVKMLIMRKMAGENKEWTPEKAIEHGKKMLLILGFNDDAINSWEQKLQ